MFDFDTLLAWLRGLAYPCAPPIGVGEFEVLYASRAEVVVWYSPAREGHRAGEVAIPCARLSAAWEALAGGALLDEAALTALGEGVGGGRWLLALLALVPGARVDPEPLRLGWSLAHMAVKPPQTSTPARRPRAKGVGTEQRAGKRRSGNTRIAVANGRRMGAPDDEAEAAQRTAGRK